MIHSPSPKEYNAVFISQLTGFFLRVGLGRTGWSKSGKQTTGSNGRTSQFIYKVTLRV